MSIWVIWREADDPVSEGTMRRFNGFLLLSACTFGMLANVLVLTIRRTVEEEMEALSFRGASSSRVIVPTQANDILPVIPLRSEEEKEFAQLCTRAHRGAVYIKHHRKAGGSSLYHSILNRNVCSHTPVFSSKLLFFNASLARSLLLDL